MCGRPMERWSEALNIIFLGHSIGLLVTLLRRFQVDTKPGSFSIICLGLGRGCSMVFYQKNTGGIFANSSGLHACFISVESLLINFLRHIIFSHNMCMNSS